MKPVDIEAAIVSAMPDAQVEIEDLTGTEDHYEVRVTSRAFEGLSRIRQHKLVYAALGSTVGAEIHALALKTRVP